MRNCAISFTLTLLSSSQLATAWSNMPDPQIESPAVLQSTTKEYEGVTHETCSRAIDRLLLDNVDFNTVLREDTGNWEDKTFSHPDAILWEDMRPIPGPYIVD